VSCVDIEGNKVGLVFITDSHTEPPALRNQAIFITAIDNGPGHTDSVGFSGGPPEAFRSCRPTLPTQPVTSGDVIVQPSR
jgi:hypothetical protein